MTSIIGSSSGLRTRVLLIEPDADVRARYSASLRRAGLAVLSMDEPPGVSEEQGPLRLVIAPADRYAVVRRTYPRVPFVVVADDVKEGVSACLLGAEDWVPRKCDPDYFIGVVTAAIGGRSIAG